MTKNARPRSTKLNTRRRPSRCLRLAVTGTVLVSSFAMTVGSAAAAVPTFPDNLLVFPNRDFVSVAGYQSHVGETALLEVTRPGVGIVGSATSVVQSGDVAFEVNHPGGVCWGNGTELKITPDILPGDKLTISFAGSAVGDTTVQDAYAIEPPAYVAGSNTFTVNGHIAASVDRTMVEQRTVNPELTSTAIARRDIRAIPGPLTPAARGGYSSSLEFAGETFTATYVFDDPANAAIAATGGGERLMTWQAVDAAANRQGVTIAEADQLGGPGMGGCPNGPLQSGPVGPTAVSAVNVPGGIKVTWTPAVATPGTPAITGYRVTAVGQTVTGNEQVEIGRRISSQAAKATTITGLSSTETYGVEVVSVSSVGETFPSVRAIPVTDTTAPIASAAPAGGSFAVPQQVTLSANEPGSELYYTTDGTDPALGDVLSPSAVHYTAAITISANTTLKYLAFDPAGNTSTIGTQVYVITNTPLPAAPVLGSSAVGQNEVTLNWSSNDPSVTKYSVQAYDQAGAPVGAARETAASTITISGLAADTPYLFTVKAQNVNGFGPESAKIGPLVPLGAVVANAGPDQRIARKTTASTVTLTGAGSTAGASYLWEQVTTGPTDPDKVALSGTGTLSPSFVLPLYKYPMTNNSLTFRLTVMSPAGIRTDLVSVTPVPDQVVIGTAKWKLGDMRVTGDSTVVGGTITVHRGSLAGAAAGQAPVTLAVLPVTGGVFDMRARNAAAGTTNPITVWIESTLGGTAGPFPVANG